MLLTAAHLRLFACLVVTLAAPCCVRDVSGEAVPADARLYFPGRLALSPDGNFAVVVNTNFDQRFVASWLTHVDLAALVAAATDANAAFAALRQGPHVASLGGPLLVDAASSRAYLAHRGLGLLTSFDLAAPTGDGQPQIWSCGHGSRAGQSNREKKTDCDTAHSFHLQMATAEAQNLGDEPDREDFLDPFALVQQQPGELAVGFLGTHRVARLSTNLPLAVTEVIEGPQGSQLVDLAMTGGNLLLGAGQMAGAESLLLGWPANESTPTHFSPSLAMGQQADRPDRGPEVVRLMPAPNQNDRVFVLARRPDTLSIAQLVTVPESALQDGAVTVQARAGRFRMRHTEVLADQALNEMAYLQRPTGNLVVASSFARDALYFFADLGDSLALVHRIRLGDGRGPAALLPVTVAGNSYLLVSTFFDHGLDLIDVSSANVTDFRLHARVQDAKFPSTNRAR